MAETYAISDLERVEPSKEDKVRVRESAKAHVAPSVFGFRVVSAHALAALSASAFALVDMLVFGNLFQLVIRVS